MERLSPLDAAFLEAEDQDRHTSMAIGSVAVFAGPCPDYEELVSVIERRLPLVPRYRQRVRQVPLRLGPPLWVDDPEVDLRFHVRQTALPPPGGDAELQRLVARVMGSRLDRDRPLWEDWLVSGLAGDRWALISKVHHCMVDGISGTDLYRVMFDSAVDGAIPPPEPARPAPSTLSLIAAVAADGVRRPARSLLAVQAAARRPVASLREARHLMGAVRSALGAVPPAQRSSLSGPIGQQRHWIWTGADLADVKLVASRLDATVNDVVLAAITGGFRDVLTRRHEQPGPHTVPSLVPVSLRAPGQEHLYDNRVSAMIVDLPVQLTDPVDQLAVLRRRLDELKHHREPLVGEAITSVAGYVPYAAWAAFVRLGFRLPQREIVTVTTNVPGPRTTLHCAGRPLVAIHPYVPIASQVRVGVAIFSYCDRISFGLTGDWDTAADLDVLAGGIGDSLRRLVAAAHAAPAPVAETTAGRPHRRPRRPAGRPARSAAD